MKTAPNFQSALVSKPIWMIRPDALKALCAADSQVGDPWWHPQVEANAGIAVLPIFGYIGKNDFWAMTDLAITDQQITNIANDPAIHTVILNINSPGGCAQGVGETAQRLVELGMAKRVIAYADQCCCSAAYYLAAAAHEIIVAESADVGSISTIAALVDDSQWFAKAGLEMVIAKTGAYKDFGYPGKPVTEQDRAWLQQLVDTVDADFKGFVTTMRPQVAPESMDGRWFNGRQSLQLGLADAIARDLTTLVVGLL